MMSSPWPLEQYRPLLCLYARGLGLCPQLLRRFDESDLVQEAMARAHVGLGAFRGTTEAEFVAWLQAALANVLRDRLRRERAGKRDPRREQQIEAVVGDSSVRLNHLLAADSETPSVAIRREERARKVAEAIARLEPDQRDAILLREMQNLAVAEIAMRMRRTEKSVAGLLLRGRKRLRELLAELSEK
jgi:RNA polymerase sigma-70 factor (ECF subfamily)